VNSYGIAAKYHVRSGRAFDEICGAAKRIDAQLIVIATHGRTGLKRVFMRITVERVVRHAACPVLAVRDAQQFCQFAEDHGSI
jgi:universal stress protein A